MKLLFFDSETIGLPRDYKASYEDLDNWPRVMSLAWMVTDTSGNVLTQHYHMIRPDGWEVPKEKFWIDNGYSQERSLLEGVELGVVLDFFLRAKAECDCLVAHNIMFDHRIVWAEIIRSGRTPKSGMEKICTMQSSTKYCALPGKKFGFKWPSLDELHRTLFKKSFDDSHNALADVIACKNCFFELVKRGVIELPTAKIDQI